ncbi:hypothetical protein [Bradyrhizobium sp. RT9a]|uniref:hypothetical protein n=1 Tax=Bradyrhizobium sp. RT9a TaxID=3156384 RepID=UPI00339859E3
MHKIVADFRALTLAQQHETFPLITAAYNATKEARRLELEDGDKSHGVSPR